MGYHGNPLNNSQCYRENSIDTVYNYTLSANQSIYLGVTPTDLVYSDVDVRATLLLDRGSVEVWATDDAEAVQVRLGASWDHVVSLDDGVELVEEGGTYLYKLSARETPDSRVVYHSRTRDEQVIVLPVHLRFQADWHYFTVRAKESSKVYFYYRQDPPRLNLVVFFGVFLSCFCIALCMTVLIWNLVQLGIQWRRARRLVQQQQMRLNRPFGSVTVCLCPMHEAPLLHNVSSKDKPLPQDTDNDGGDGYNMLQDLNSSTENGQFADKQVWPVVVQSTRDNCSSVGTVLVQLPSSRNKLKATVCVGSTLVNNLTATSGLTKRAKFKKSQLVPKSQAHSTRL